MTDVGETGPVRDRAHEPGDREPAPGALAHVQAFVNTVDLEDGHEEFSSPAALGVWFVRHGCIDADDANALTEDELRETIQVREAIRALLIANAGGPPSTSALALLTRQATNAQLNVTFHETGSSLLPQASGCAGALGRLLAIAVNAMADGTWVRLKACRYDRCQWAYFDTSKNRSGSWCSMAICGNKVKTRMYRARQRTISGGNSAQALNTGD